MGIIQDDRKLVTRATHEDEPHSKPEGELTHTIWIMVAYRIYAD